MEVIDENGRVFSCWNQPDVVVQLQDDGRTLKVFTHQDPAKPKPVPLQDALLEDALNMPPSRDSIQAARQAGLSEEQIVKMFGRHPY